METFIENLTRNAVATASTNAEQNVYADALGAFRMLTPNQQKAFEIAYTTYQRKWYLSIGYKTEKAVSKESKASGIPFVVKHSKVVTHFDDYQSLVARAGNNDFVAEQRKWGTRINDVCVYHNSNLYLSMKPTWTFASKYFIPTADGVTEIDYATEQSLLVPSARDAYKSQKTAERQGVETENIVRCADIKIENVAVVKCGATQEVNEIELAI